MVNPCLGMRLHLIIAHEDLFQQVGTKPELRTLDYGLDYRIAGNFRGENFREILQLCGYLRKFSPRNLGAWCLLARQKRAICESFLCKNLFFTNPRKFSPLKVSRYTVQTQFWSWLDSRILLTSLIPRPSYCLSSFAKCTTDVNVLGVGSSKSREINQLVLRKVTFCVLTFRTIPAQLAIKHSCHLQMAGLEHSSVDNCTIHPFTIIQSL